MINNISSRIFLFFYLFILFNIFNLALCYTESSITNIVLYITYAVLFYSVSTMKIKHSYIKCLSVLSSFYLLFILFIQVADKQIMNPNSVAVSSFIVCYFLLLSVINDNKTKKRARILVICVFAGYIVYFSGSRSVMLSVIFSILTYFIWNKITKNKLLFNLYFGIIVLFILTSTLVYPRISAISNDFSGIQDFVIKYTGKGLYSGRENIWDKLLEAIKLKPLFGYGTGMLAINITGLQLSAHNAYLDIILRLGLIGLSFIVILFFNLWNAFWKNRYDGRVILSACFFIGIIINQINETILLLGSVFFNFPIWILFGIGLNFSLKSKTELKFTQKKLIS